MLPLSKFTFIGLVLATALSFTNAHAAVTSFCISPNLLDDLIKVSTVIGCRTPDCCPRCRSDGKSVDIRVTATGVPVTDIALQATDAEHVRSPASRTDETTSVSVWDVRTEVGGEVAEAVIVPKLDPTWLREVIARQQGEDFRLELTIEQMIGQVVVAKQENAFVLNFCDLEPAEDKVTLSSNSEGDEAVVMLSGRRNAGCFGFEDEDHTVQTTESVPNILSPGACAAETLVFSDGDAVQFQDAALWTNATGDEEKISISNRITVPLSIWLMQDGISLTTIQSHVIKASTTYDDQHCGIEFSAVVQDKRAEDIADDITEGGWDGACWGTEWFQAIYNSGAYTPGALNVYYTEHDDEYRGMNCFADRNIILVSKSFNSTTLSHEIGHAFNLNHINDLPGFTRLNVMHGKSDEVREEFTEGQCFRMNASPKSMLNINGNRAGKQRYCPDFMESDTCITVDHDR